MATVADCATYPSDCLDVALLNRLDGFNTQPRLSIPFDGAIDPASVNSNTVFLIRFGSLQNPADAPAPIVGINQVVWDPATLTLFAHSNEHLDQDSNYLLIVMRGVRDASGDPIEAGSDFTKFPPQSQFRPNQRPATEVLSRLVSPNARRDVSRRSRSRFALPATLCAASVFTTGSVTSTLQKIRDQIKGAPALAVAFTLGTHGERTVFSISSVIGILYGQQTHTTGPLNVVPVPTPALQVFPGSVASIAFGRFSGMNFETPGGFIPAVPTRTGVPAVQRLEDISLSRPVRVLPAVGPSRSLATASAIAKTIVRSPSPPRWHITELRRSRSMLSDMASERVGHLRSSRQAAQLFCPPADAV